MNPRARNNDDAVAFRQLKQWASQTDYPLRIAAEQSYQSIVDFDARTSFFRKPSNIASEVISSITANITNFDYFFPRATPDENIDLIDWYTRAAHDNEFKKRQRILTRIMEIYKTNDNLRVVSFVGRIFSREYSPNPVSAEHPISGKPEELGGRAKPLDMDKIQRNWTPY